MNYFPSAMDTYNSSFIIHYSSFTTMPDLFDLFKENDSQPHERPSEQVWQKLEKRLDKSRRPKRRDIRFLQMWVVGLIVLFLLFTAAMVWYFVRK